MQIYISNLTENFKEEDLKQLFASYGEVKSAEIVYDAFNGRSRGFGYVELENEAAEKAIAALNNTKLNDLTITVREYQKEREQKGSYKVGDGSFHLPQRRRR